MSDLLISKKKIKTIQSIYYICKNFEQIMYIFCLKYTVMKQATQCLNSEEKVRQFFNFISRCSVPLNISFLT